MTFRNIITTKELKDNYGLSRVRVRQLQAEHGWVKVGHGVWDFDSAWPYLEARQRTALLLAKGWITSNQLIWHDLHDHICPVCEAFAVFKPPTLAETRDSNVDIYGDGWAWVCANGHKG